MEFSRYQFAYLTDPPDYLTIQDLDLPALEEAAGIPLSWEIPVLQQEMGIKGGPSLLLDAINNFLEAHLIEQEAPNLTRARKYYEDIRKHANSLKHLLDGEDPKIRRLRARLIPVSPSFDTFQQLLEDIEQRAIRTSSELDEKPGKAGRPEMLAKQNLLAAIYQVWKTAGGEGLGIHWDAHWDDHAGPYYALTCRLIWRLQELKKLQGFPSLSTIHEGLGSACLKAAKDYQPEDTKNLELWQRE